MLPNWKLWLMSSNFFKVINLVVSCIRGRRRVWYTWSFRSTWMKTCSGFSWHDLTRHLLEHISQSINSESFHTKENGSRTKCEEEVHFSEKLHSVRTVELPTKRNCLGFIMVHSCDCCLLRQYGPSPSLSWILHNIFHFCTPIRILNYFWISKASSSSVLCVCKAWDVKIQSPIKADQIK